MQQKLFDGVEAFVATVEERSFSEAARRLGVTPPAISKAVRRLEEQLGVRLLHRTTRRVELSAEGAVFVEHCVQAIEAMRRGRRDMEVAQVEVRGQLTLSAPPALARSLSAALASFRQRFPAVDLQLTLTDRYVGLADEGIDVALRIGQLEESSLVARRLAHPRMLTVASPTYLKERGVPERPNDLGVHACLVYRYPNGQLAPWLFCADDETVRTRVPPSPVMTADSGDALIEAAIAGVGIVQAFDFMVTSKVAAGDLVEVLSGLTTVGAPLHALCLPGQRHIPRVRAALDHLAEWF